MLGIRKKGRGAVRKGRTGKKDVMAADIEAAGADQGMNGTAAAAAGMNEEEMSDDEKSDFVAKEVDGNGIPIDIADAKYGRSEHRASRVELVKEPDGKVLTSVERVTSVDSQKDAIVKADTADADGASQEKKKMGGSSKLMSYMYGRRLIINIDLYPLTATNVYATLRYLTPSWNHFLFYS
jgi:hypothetical protein